MVVGTRRHEARTLTGATRIGNKVSPTFVWPVRPQFTDIFSGYRAFSRRFVKSFPVLSEGFEIETEMSVHALELRMPVGEVEHAISRAPKLALKASTFRDGWRILKTIVTL